MPRRLGSRPFAARSRPPAGVEVFHYPGTGHAFFNDDRPQVYHPQAAALAWERTLDLFHRRLPV